MNSEKLTIPSNEPAQKTLHFFLSKTVNPYIALLAITVIGAGFAFALLKHAENVRQDIKKINEGIVYTPEHMNRGGSDALDTTNWKTYRNEEYGFEVRYPPLYKLIGPDIESSPPVSGQILSRHFRYVDEEFGSRMYITATKNQKGATIGGMTVAEHVEFIKNPNNHEWSDHLFFNERIIPIFYFPDNPTAFGDNRDTIVALIENGNTTFFIYKSDVNELDTEFKKILSTFKFTEPNSAQSFCAPKFKVESGPELTASEAYSNECILQDNKADCEAVDIYHAGNNNFGNADGIPDCEWIKK